MRAGEGDLAGLGRGFVRILGGVVDGAGDADVLVRGQHMEK